MNFMQNLSDLFSNTEVVSRGSDWEQFSDLARNLNENKHIFVAGALVGGLTVTALIAGGIVVPVCGAVAVGYVVVGAVAGGSIGIIAKEPIKELFKNPPQVPNNFPGFNLTLEEIKFPPFGNGIAPTMAELLQNARNLDTGRPGSWKN